jgi:hypothetical protein
MPLAVQMAGLSATPPTSNNGTHLLNRAWFSQHTFEILCQQIGWTIRKKGKYAKGCTRGCGANDNDDQWCVRRNRQPRQTADYFTDGRRSVCAEGNRRGPRVGRTCLAIARSHAEALEALRRCSHSVDLLLADVVMPGMSGRELATEFNTLCPSEQVLLMSDGANVLALYQLSLFLREVSGQTFFRADPLK